MYQKFHGIPRVERKENSRGEANRADTEHAQHKEPYKHERAEQFAYACRSGALHEENAGYDDDHQRKHGNVRTDNR